MSTFSMFRRPATIALSLTASIAIVACNPTPTPTATVTNVAVTAPVATLVVGATTQAKAAVTGTNNPAQTVIWTTSDAKIVTVSNAGLITAVSPGKAVVSANSTVSGFTSKSGSVNITVNPATGTTPTVTAVAVTLTPASVAVGGTSQATASVTGTNSPAQTVTWTSSDMAVAMVNATGLVTAVTPGTADIVATSTVDNTKKGQATLTVTAVGTRPTVKINFAPAGSTVATYDTNSGAAYTAASMTGWITEASAGTAAPAPLDMTKNTRPNGAAIVLTTAEPAQLTQINMQCGVVTTGNTCASGTLTSGAFEYKMADGKYNVTVSVGDASAATNAGNLNSSHTINVEGTNIIKDFVPTSAKIFMKSAPTLITVSGGVMTIDAKGGKNTKINYIELVPVN